jgi:hypothetical protein
VLALIRRNLTDLRARYGDARRTQIADRTKGALTARDVLPDQEVWVTLSTDGLLSRVARAGGRHPLLATGGGLPGCCLPVNTRQDLYVLSAKGQATRVPAYQIPDGVGAHYADISGLTRRDRVAALCAFPQAHGDEAAPGYLLLGTARGKVKRVALADVAAQAHTNPQVIGLDTGDELAWAGVSAGGGEILLVTAAGQAIRFTEEDVRAMGLPAGGIGGIKLQGKDRVIAGCGIPSGADPQTSVALITAGGFGKRVPLSEFPVQGRNGQGVIAAKPAPRTGDVAGAALVAPADLLACLVGGAIKVVRASVLPTASRSSSGKPVLALGSGQQVQAVTGAVGPAAEETAPSAPLGAKPAAKKPGAAAKAKPAAKAEVKTEKPPARTAGPKEEAAPKRKPAAEVVAKPARPEPASVIASGSTQSAALPETSSEAISVPGVARQPAPKKTRAATEAAVITPARGKPAAEAAPAVPRTGKAAAEAAAVAVTKGKPTAEAASVAPAKRAPAKAEAGQMPLVPPPAEKKAPAAVPKQQPTPARKSAVKPAPEASAAKPAARAPAGKPSAPPTRGGVAPADDIAVKEMKGRSISRADLEKLIRGEISKLPSDGPAAQTPPQTFEVSETSKVSKPSAPKKPSPVAAGETTAKSSGKMPPSSGKTPSGSAARKQPDGKPSSGSASSKPSSGKTTPAAVSSKPASEPASSSKPKAARSAKPKSGDTVGKAGPAKPTSETAKPSAMKKTKP